MRWLLVGLGLVLGAIAAIPIFGRIDHLRAIVPDLVPAALATVDDGSGLLAGQARLPEGAPAAGVVTWTWVALDAQGAVWRVGLAGEGIDMRSRLRIDAGLTQAVLTDGSGRIDLARLDPGNGIEGLLSFERLEIAYDLSRRTVTRIDGGGTIENAGFDGADLGQGTFDLAADVGGGWRLTLRTNGPAAAIEGRVSGHLARRDAAAAFDLTAGPALPDRWADTLPFVAQPAGDGRWRLERRVPF